MKDGIISVYKPSGMTSNDVIYKMRSILGIKKLGHTGTLDPLATGVLPVCINKSTRVAEYMDVDFKTYVCTMILGVTTDTYDITGNVTDRSSDFASVTASNIQDAFSGFKGLIDQIPPLTSAVRIEGKRLYEFVHEGVDIPPEIAEKIKPRQIYIKSLTIDSFKPVGPGSADECKAHVPGPATTGGCSIYSACPEVTFTIECSKGTYIRSIVRDVGELLGCGATMTGLERIASGAFNKENSVTLDELVKISVEEGFCKIEQKEADPENDRFYHPSYKLISNRRYSEDIPEVFEKYVRDAGFALSGFGIAMLDDEHAIRFLDGWHIGYGECRITAGPEFGEITDEKGRVLTKDDLRDANPDSESNHHGSYPGLKIHPEYRGAYRMYRESDGLFLGVAIHSDKYHKLVCDKVVARAEDIRK